MLAFAVDVESTGIYNARIISTGLVLFKFDEASKTAEVIMGQDYFNTIDRKIEPQAIQTHGITNSRLVELAEGKSRTEVGAEISSMLEKVNYIIGHNVGTDISLLQKDFYYRKPINLKVLDSNIRYKSSPNFNKLSRLNIACEKVFGDRILTELIPEFKAKVRSKLEPRYHSAAFDAYMSGKLYFELSGYKWI